MKSEMKLFDVSLLDTFLYFVPVFVLSSAFIFLFTLINGNPRLGYSESAVFSQLILPLTISISRNAFNRNGVLRLSELEDRGTLTNTIESTLNKGYIRVDASNGDFRYVKKKKWARFIDYFVRESILAKTDKDEIQLLGKKGLLEQIETSLQAYDKTE